MAPEGSYSSNPDGPERIREFRQMVQALNQAGLRVVMDMVFNHVYTPGSGSLSNLEKIVPGYYHRLDPCGEIMLSTCCPDTATENRMMEKLMVDSLVHWATVYKIDGFRFDLMGHHLTRNMESALRLLRGLDTESTGVDGSQIFLYGEGWDFGGLAHSARGENASQINLAGRGIGTFNDRIRDAIRGGGAFQGYREAGFAFGKTEGEAGQAQKRLLELSLAGNLADFPTRDASGRVVPGRQISYHGSSAGYSREPWESIQYVSSHDNETWFDAVQIKSEPGETLDDRLRVHRLGLSLLCLTQGIPFFHAGDEILRSKSLDRNSYNSGDWFNRLDYSYRSNNWGVGLPLKEENAAHWLIQKELLSRPELRPTPNQIRLSLNLFEEMLRIRRSTPLLRLRTAEAVIRQVSFLDQPSGVDENLVVMRIVDDPAESLDPNYREILILVNTAGGKREWGIPDRSDPYPDYSLHPVLVNSSDPLMRDARYQRQEGLFLLPGRTVLVFVAPRQVEEMSD
jgi:pullulanase-type alpha-1,6-glucosidase